MLALGDGVIFGVEPLADPLYWNPIPPSPTSRTFLGEFIKPFRQHYNNSSSKDYRVCEIYIFLRAITGFLAIIAFSILLFKIK